MSPRHLRQSHRPGEPQTLLHALGNLGIDHGPGKGSTLERAKAFAKKGWLPSTHPAVLRAIRRRYERGTTARSWPAIWAAPPRSAGLIRVIRASSKAQKSSKSTVSPTAATSLFQPSPSTSKTPASFGDATVVLPLNASTLETIRRAKKITPQSSANFGVNRPLQISSRQGQRSEVIEAESGPVAVRFRLFKSYRP